MAEMLINNWGWWIWDDSFLVRNGECLDMDSIDIRTTPRRITCDNAFLGTYGTSTHSGLWVTLNYVTESIDWLVQSYSNACFFDSVNPWLVAGADVHITVGSNFTDYNATTNPEWVRTFFFTYNGTTNPISIVGYSWGVRAVLTTINTSGWAAPANIVANLHPTAVCYLWKWAIIFSRGSKIYEINPETSTLSTWAKVDLPVGAVVKFISYQWGVINFVYTINNDTYVHSCTYDGTTYKLYPYASVEKWEKCISATTNGSSIYWLSTNGIFQFNGNNQFVRKYTLTTNARCSFNKWVLRIIDGTNFIEYGVQKPWYGTPLTRKSLLTVSGQWVTENNIITLQSGTNQFRYDSVQSGAYKSSSYWISHPYTAGQFGWKKKGLGFFLWIAFPTIASYVDSSTQCSITVSVQTDLIERANSTLYVTVATITDSELRNYYIDLGTIRKALETAWYSEEFGYVRIKLTLNAWDAYGAYGGTLFRKTPEIYDLYLHHEEIANPFK